MRRQNPGEAMKIQSLYIRIELLFLNTQKVCKIVKSEEIMKSFLRILKALQNRCHP